MFSLLSKLIGLFGGSVAKELASAYRARQQAMTDAEKIAADERIANLKALMADRANAREFGKSAVANPVLIWPISVFVWFTALYYGAIVLDSIWFHSGSVKQMPAFAQGWSEAIIYSVFTPVAGGAGAALVLKAWRGR